MKRYKEVSRQVMEILRSFSPLVQQASVDEAYIDLTGTELISGNPRQAAESIKKKIREQIFLTCSIGVSTSKLAAKIASDIEKPDGLTIISPPMVKDFLESRPIGDIPGVGAKSEMALFDIGVKCLGDILRLSPSFLHEKFGKAGERLISIVNGDDISPVEPWIEPKSISNERTLSRDTSDPGVIEKNLLMLSNKVARRLRKQGFAGRTVTLKLKGSDFRQITRSVTFQKGTQSARVILKEAKKLLSESIPTSGVRLIGVGVSKLERGGYKEQLSLFDTGESEGKKWQRAERAIDDILNRFGEGALGPGSFLE
jgi:DNA polymerase-4